MQMGSLDRVRLRLEDREELLAPRAARSALGRGRAEPEEPSPLRTEYQRDRDRIIHSKAFRRLKHKTQVFIAPMGDHYVTRLTHTLEVAQISRTIARALEFNEDLTEAIALGHDLGHTPFGHVGEEALDRLDPQGFRHARQSLRTVESLEKGGRGLNLTWEVRQGIVSHSKPRGEFLQSEAGSGAGDSLGLEGQVVRVSDAVAYLNHDVDDAFRAGILSQDGLPEVVVSTLGGRHSRRIDTMVGDIVKSSWEAARSDEPAVISMSRRVREAVYALREFMFERVYLSEGQSAESAAAAHIVELLYDYYGRHKEEIPPEYHLDGEEHDRAVSDYIAGMTDHFAIRAAERIEPGAGAAFKSRLL